MWRVNAPLETTATVWLVFLISQRVALALDKCAFTWAGCASYPLCLSLLAQDLERDGSREIHLRVFSKLFGAGEVGKAQPQKWPLPAPLNTDLIWSSGTSLPIPDWQSIEAPPETSGLYAFWSSAARLWLERLKEQLGETYRLPASDHFIMLAPLADRTCKLILDHSERSRRHMLHLLDGIATAYITGQNLRVDGRLTRGV